VEDKDRVLETEVTFQNHVLTRTYIDNATLLSRFGDNQEIEHLRVAGFHIWDCVEKFAKEAHGSGVDVLIDEDLTEFLTSRIRSKKGFKRAVYPSYNPRLYGRNSFNQFMRARRGKPWFWQEY
jgi:hypothetical protein